MSPRGIVGYHIGIAPDSKGWLFWIPSKNSIVKSASAKIDESTFYKKGDISSIQALNVFDDSMIREIESQDKIISSLQSNCDISNMIPTNYKEAFKSNNFDDWKAAINDESARMNDEKVFKIPERYKAQLVARGFRQIQGINFEETFAPTPTFNALRLLFSTAVLMKWEIKTFDVKVAFLHSFIDKPVYMWPPHGLQVPKHHLLKLEKALYGTKQAARCWWLHLKQIFQKIGFVANKEDPSTYSFESNEGKALL
ncbi:hypothetical protein O181_072869 [Austropuccinia psidii MF-1]|uniref:Reverse transcriptase Ty1/copia-type domain-containing protein n=1 Tax=Austropuccinia psidii MF-1 TaxID=1389203 RepID=A0A9Q3IBX2_9BASI|nr:hypothetical protein [Austropuccinia psidii MF-1]